MPEPRFWAAMACYGVLGIAAGLTLDRKASIVVWLFLGAFAVKTWISMKRQRDDNG